MSRFHNDFPSDESLQKIAGQSKPWIPPEYTDISPVQLSKVAANIVRDEFKLQSEFGLFLLDQGHNVLSFDFKLPGANGTLKPDFWIKDLGLIVEAKPSISREHIRMAIGQVLDYVHLAAQLGLQMKPAVLLPSLPSNDLVDLIQELGIQLIYKSDMKFHFHNQ